MSSKLAACPVVSSLWFTGSYQRSSCSLQKSPTSHPMALHRRPCQWFPTTKPALGRQVFLVTCGSHRPGISVPSRESPYSSTGCPVGFPELLPSTSLENAETPNTLLLPLDLSSVEWSRGRWNLESLSAVGHHLPFICDQKAQASGLQGANHVLINSFEDESIPLSNSSQTKVFEE